MKSGTEYIRKIRSLKGSKKEIIKKSHTKILELQNTRNEKVQQKQTVSNRKICEVEIGVLI